MKSTGKTRIAGIISLALLAVCGVAAFMWHEQIWAVLTNGQARAEFIGWVRQSGLAGLAAVFGVQVVQVVLAFLPGEPVELAAGLLYGAWGGLALCLLGIFAGSVGVYYVAKLLGARTMQREKLTRYKFLRDEAHVKFALFLLFFIPGTPKDWLIYLGPFLPIRPRDFFLLSTLARVPSILSSTFTAASFAAGSWKVAAITYGATALAAALCVWKEDAILRWIEARRSAFHGGRPGAGGPKPD